MALVVFSVCWFPLRFNSPVTTMDATIISFTATFAVLYLLVFWSTDCGLYRSWSVTDGWNVMTRFTLKLGLSDEQRTFLDSNMPCSISDSVSTRGTTLNKLMIGMCFTLAALLFIKYVQVPHPTGWSYTMAFGYVCIIFTGIFENRTFELEKIKDQDDNPHPIEHHREDLTLLLDDSPGPMTKLDKITTATAYSVYHMGGVVLFVVATYVGQTGNLFDDHTRRIGDLSAWWAWGVATFGLGMAALFLFLNAVLTGECFRCGLRSDCCCVKKASKDENRCRGLCCITIEFCALVATVAAGVVLQTE